MSEPVLGVGPADVVPNAGEPMGDDHVETDEQDQHHRSILDVPVDLPDHSAQPEQPDNFEGAEQRADSLLLLSALDSWFGLHMAQLGEPRRCGVGDVG